MLLYFLLLLLLFIFPLFPMPFKNQFIINYFKPTTKQIIVRLIKKYLPIIVKVLIKYPRLYKRVKFSLTILASFYYCLYYIGFALHNKFKNNFPLFYSITLYIYSEYLVIQNGNLSNNMRVILASYVILYYNDSNLILYILLIVNAWLKKHLMKDTRLKEHSPNLYRVLLDISSLINTIVIFYFLDCIFIDLIKPFILKVWNGILKMASPDNVNTGELSNNKNMPDPQKPSDIPILKKDEDEDYKEKVLKEFERFKKANKEFSSKGKKEIKDLESSYMDLMNDYEKYLPEAEKERLSNLIKADIVDFKLNEEDSVHQFWLNKRVTARQNQNNILGIMEVFAKNSKIIQEQMGGKKSLRSQLFRRETEKFKNQISAPYKSRETIIRRELEKSRVLDKLLREKNLSIKKLIDNMGKW